MSRPTDAAPHRPPGGPQDDAEAGPRDDAEGGPQDDAGPARTWVVVSYFRDRSHYPRSGRAARRDAVYWANIAVNAATLRHVAGQPVEFVACAGEPPPAPAADVLARAGGRVRQVPFTHQPPDDFYTRYTGSLYLLDTMAAMADEVADDDVALFVDPDIAWVRPIAPLIAEVRRGGVVAYDLEVADDALPLCGLSRRQQGEILTEIAGHGPDGVAPRHFGGEIYGLSGRELRAVLAEIAPLWDATMERYRRGRPHYHVEEHLMNAVLWRRGEQTGRANPHLQRIVTLPAPFGTQHKAQAELVAWHLPLEKDRGFPRLLAHLARGGGPPEPGPDYRAWLARRLGIAPAGARVVADRLRRAKWALNGRARQGTRYHGL